MIGLEWKKSNRFLISLQELNLQLCTLFDCQLTQMTSVTFFRCLNHLIVISRDFYMLVLTGHEIGQWLCY